MSCLAGVLGIICSLIDEAWKREIHRKILKCVRSWQNRVHLVTVIFSQELKIDFTLVVKFNMKLSLVSLAL